MVSVAAPARSPDSRSSRISPSGFTPSIYRGSQERFGKNDPERRLLRPSAAGVARELVEERASCGRRRGVGEEHLETFRVATADLRESRRRDGAGIPGSDHRLVHRPHRHEGVDREEHAAERARVGPHRRGEARLVGVLEDGVDLRRGAFNFVCENSWTSASAIVIADG